MGAKLLLKFGMVKWIFEIFYFFSHPITLFVFSKKQHYQHIRFFTLLQ